MGRKLYLAPGQRFGRLLVTAFAGTDTHGKRLWKCVCDCGTRRTVFGFSLVSGKTNSCGCMQRELTSKRHRTHGMYHTREYRTWADMIQRTTNQRCACFPRYGGRGIVVCTRWQKSFAAFFADIGPRPAGMSIDRINNDLGYCPGNVRWATPSEQRRNQRPRSQWRNASR